MLRLVPWIVYYEMAGHAIKSILRMLYTVKPVCNDHLYDKIYYLWFIQ